MTDITFTNMTVWDTLKDMLRDLYCDIYKHNPQNFIIDFDRYDIDKMSDVMKFSFCSYMLRYNTPTPTLYKNLDALFERISPNITHPDGYNLLLIASNNEFLANYIFEKMDKNVLYRICPITGGSILTGWKLRGDIRHMIYNENIFERILNHCPDYLIDLPDNYGYTPIYYNISYNRKNYNKLLQRADLDYTINEREGISVSDFLKDNL